MNNIQKKARPNHLSLVESLPTFREPQKTFKPASTLEDPDCRLQTFRIEVKTSDAKSLHYPIRSTNKMDARSQAAKLVSDMAYAYQDNRIAWRMAGEQNWTFQGAVKDKKSLWRRAAEYFFILDEETQVDQAK